MDVNDDKNPVTPKLWHTMSVQQLENEKNILIARRNAICDMESSSPSIVAMYKSINEAITFLTQLINKNENRQ